MRLKLDGTSERIQAKYLFAYQGISKVAHRDAEAGELLPIGDLKDIQIGETLADVKTRMFSLQLGAAANRANDIGVNTSP